MSDEEQIFFEQHFVTKIPFIFPFLLRKTHYHKILCLFFNKYELSYGSLWVLCFLLVRKLLLFLWVLWSKPPSTRLFVKYLWIFEIRTSLWIFLNYCFPLPLKIHLTDKSLVLTVPQQNNLLHFLRIFEMWADCETYIILGKYASVSIHARYIFLNQYLKL